MAARHLSTLPFRSSFASTLLPQSQRWGTIYPRLVLLHGLPLLSGYIANEVPSFLAGLWESVLRAVPKKKTSHMKKRHRQMAGKALKDVKNLSKCPGCGEVKRSHVLCPNCVADIKEHWKEAAKEEKTTMEEKTAKEAEAARRAKAAIKEENGAAEQAAAIEEMKTGKN
ncbi:hypothetical protein UA08_04361 [Talaromyces atroroseus]|uniref:Large ribosomal subunit protein bL32m n=1 Tax=Talaromyces atroroseus TaxID=1441469 RepID=A0A1Q5Q9B8_TALAT|nr:hypothetical protein UA08_04361 [Talaromyces atroroseus]OKL60728.1 hypothetical protein UA08_04361 [Talaromyces atroroseus]